MLNKLKISPLRFAIELLVMVVVFGVAAGFLGLLFAMTYYGWSEETRELISNPDNIDLLKVPTFFVLPFVFFAMIAVIEVFMRFRDMSFRDLGVRSPEKWGLTIYRAIGLAAGIYLISIGIQWGLAQFGETVNLEMFNIIHDDPVMYVWGMTAVAWFAAGFCEEAIFRGYIMNHLAALLGGKTPGIIIAVIFQAILFAGLHYDQDWAGVLPVLVVGLALGAAYYMFGRNLWPLIIAHALIDSTSFTLLYFGIIG